MTHRYTGAFMPLGKTGSGDAQPSLARLSQDSTLLDETVTYCLPGRIEFLTIIGA